MKKGSHHTEETKRKSGLAISRSLMGHRCAEETKEKLHLSNLGKHRKGLPMDVEVVARRSQSMMGHVVTATTRAKIAAKATGRPHSVATREYLSKIQKGKVLSSETIAKMVKSRTGLKRSPEACQSISRGRKGIKFSPEQLVNMSKVQLLLWCNPEHRDKMVRAIVKGNCPRPNKPETSLLNLLCTSYPGEWKYVGDGSLVIGGKNPDYTNINGRKMFIELFGDYWHKGENPQDRIDLFKQYGYDTLVIWERELKDKDKVLARLAEFVAMQTSLIHNKESV